MAAAASPTAFRLLAFAFLALAVAFLVFFVGLRLAHYGYFGPSIMDDAFFFVRYAGNFLDTGVFAWNRGEGPVHGNTSQAYQLLATVLHALDGRNVVLTPALAAALGALAYAVALPAAWLTARPQLDPLLRLLTGALVAVLVAFDGQLWLMLGTGMETTWAMALVALSLLASYRVQNGHVGAGAVALNAALVAVLYATRPDAVLLALAAPAGLALFGGTRALRLAAWRVLSLAITLIGLVIVLCWLYYGDPLPLAFFAKSLPVTALPPEQHDILFGSPLDHLRFTLELHAPETVLAALSLLLFPSLSPVLRGAALGMLAFVLYHCLLVLPIMGYFGRFFAPMLPVLTLLALHATEMVLRRAGLPAAPRSIGPSSIRLGGIALLAGLALLVAHKAVPTGVRVVTSHLPAVAADPALDTKAINTREGALRHVAQNFSFFHGRMVQMVEALGEDCSIAATEDGLLSAYAARTRIVDYSGLHDRAIARDGFSAARMLVELKPDVLAMPADWYASWTRAMEAHPALARDYVVEPAFHDRGFPIAFRRDSACAARVRHAVYGR